MKGLLPHIDKDAILEVIRASSVTSSLAVISYFDSTYTFIIALCLAFFMNIFAGFRADEVRVRLKRVFPPAIWFENFRGNKFKDSLAELALILIVIYAIKGVFDLMGVDESSVIAVQTMMGIAIYVYFRNSLRNLTTVYPRIIFFKILYALIALKFKNLFGEDIANIVDKEEKEHDKKSDNN
jgi:hypothetical protein